MAIRFDDSLATLARCVRHQLGDRALEDGVVVRDASGRLAFFSRNAVPDALMGKMVEEIVAALGPYARDDLQVAVPDDPGAATVLADPSTATIEVDGVPVQVLDRRIVGADWIRGPLPPVETGPPRLVFASAKGGVGRSTAVSVAAADAARRGKNVLVVDLDLEAPGIGSLLLDEDRRPAFGSLDYLVESGISDIADANNGDFVGTSALTAGAGQVDVIPVLGRTSIEHPATYMAKLSRAMIEAIKPEGGTISVSERLRQLVDRFAGARSYDLVLIDARAGIAELTAGPLLGLGASTVFLFTTAQRQSVEAYRLLFAHLATLVSGPPSPWRTLQMVHARATLDDDAHRRLGDEMWQLFSEYLYEEAGPSETAKFNFSASDPTAPHSPIPILFDANFIDWDPVNKPTQLSAALYEATFGKFLNRVHDA